MYYIVDFHYGFWDTQVMGRKSLGDLGGDTG